MGHPNLPRQRFRYRCYAFTFIDGTPPFPHQSKPSRPHEIPVFRLWEFKVEADVTERHVTIVEERSPCDGQGEHTRFSIVRLRFTTSTKMWSLYRRDLNLKFHAYEIKPSPHIDNLLDYIENSSDRILSWVKPQFALYCVHSNLNAPSTHPTPVGVITYQ